ncbi:SDR family NAD(P)-dependent oxidoreductase [Ruixingdingia sedimenti]|uniref:SDR family NAD(P)-dependent oxidoreductase n=1 Tax=Ruixingdingia sedimenti TaxID=3073604 RepID=A0ABU1FDD3_9RHOB|nr:SDR family NAD(P)-dependent oxidoreductase [Xinfangfangia sp. LG-4]MDR5654593.1 SDR family NAD(P)-dependent oxidoreductase [Xinfangfangia sp. LG-4]
MINLQGQVAIVTGAGRGMGRAHALDLAKRGATVVVNDLGALTVAGAGRDSAVAESVAGEIIAAGGRAMADGADVASPADTEALVQRVIDTFGRIDILVNNAGNQRFLRFAETEREDYDSLVGIHLGGAFNMTRAVWPQMVAQGYGRVVFTTSQVGFYGQVDAVAYGAAKNGVLGLMHGIKLDAEAAGIRVNCISPFAFTRMVVDLFPKELAEELAPEFVSAGVTYLSSPDCTLNGEVLIAGGGHFAIARTIETLGIDIADPARITAETVLDRIGTITDTTRIGMYPDALAAVQVTFDRLAEQAKAKGA